MANISIQNPPEMAYVEWALEIISLCMILIGMWGLKDEKSEQLKEKEEQISGWAQKQETLGKSQKLIYDGAQKKKRRMKKNG